jgi:hypothetical protein
LLLNNDTNVPHDVVLRASLPEGWTPQMKDTTYRLGPHSGYPVQLFLTAPASKSGAQSQELGWTLLEDGKQVGKASLLVYPEYNGVPQ